VTVSYQENSAPTTVPVEMLLNDPLGAPQPVDGQAQVAGRVETLQQAAVRALPLVLLTVTDRHWVQVAPTDVDGRFEFTHLAQGQYAILPQVHRWETVDPVHILFNLDQPDIRAQ